MKHSWNGLEKTHDFDPKWPYTRTNPVNPSKGRVTPICLVMFSWHIWHVGAQVLIQICSTQMQFGWMLQECSWNIWQKLRRKIEDRLRKTSRKKMKTSLHHQAPISIDEEISESKLTEWPGRRSAMDTHCAAAPPARFEAGHRDRRSLLSITYQSLSVTISHRQYAHLWKLMVSSI